MYRSDVPNRIKGEIYCGHVRITRYEYWGHFSTGVKLYISPASISTDIDSKFQMMTINYSYLHSNLISNQNNITLLNSYLVCCQLQRLVKRGITN